MSYSAYSSSLQFEFEKKIRVFVVNKFDNSREETVEAQVFLWATVAELKKKLESLLRIPITLQRLFFCQFELKKTNQTLETYGISFEYIDLASKSTLILRPPPKFEFNGFIQSYDIFPTSNDWIEDMIREALKGFSMGLVPKLSEDGTSGTYLIHSIQRSTIAIFKPHDEEPFTPNNPKGFNAPYKSTSFRQGILSGESAVREVAAYILDNEGIHGVPPTTYVELGHSYFEKKETIEFHSPTNKKNQAFNFLHNEFHHQKEGSFQLYAIHNDIVANYGPSMFTLNEVQKIAILDLRIINCDRNEENILVRRIPNTKTGKNDLKLIPIDHGLSMPDTVGVCSDEIVWMDWPQVKEPVCKDLLDYISTINPLEDVETLSSKLKIRDDCLKYFRAAEILLIKGVKAGLTLFEIGKILFRNDPDEKSKFEEIMDKSKTIYETMKPLVKNNPWSLSKSKELELLSNKSSFKKNSIPEEEKMSDLPDALNLNRNRSYSQDHSFKSSNIASLVTPLLTEKLDNFQKENHKKSHNIHSDIFTFSNKREPPRLKKSISLIELNQNKSVKKKGKKKKLLKEFKDTKLSTDDLFFYYVDNFMEQFVTICVNDRNKKLSRSRFYSTQIQDGEHNY